MTCLELMVSYYEFTVPCMKFLVTCIEFVMTCMDLSDLSKVHIALCIKSQCPI